MVQPKPKPIHDYPVGCYLNYMKDPNWHSCSKSSSNASSEKLRGVMNQVNLILYQSFTRFIKIYLLKFEKIEKLNKLNHGI